MIQSLASERTQAVGRRHLELMLMPASKAQGRTRTTTARNSVGRVQIVSATNLGGIPWLVHGFSTRKGGFSEVYGKASLNLSPTKEDTHTAVEENRDAFLKKLNTTDWPVVEMRQVHSDVIHCVSSIAPSLQGCGIPILGMQESLSARERAFSSAHIPGFPQGLIGDGLITDVPGILLAVKTADCMPVIIVDKKKKAVGIFHAGWRGTLNRIVEKGVGEMRRWFNSKAENLQAALGPSIRDCCYKVGEEVRDQFRSQFAYADELFREWQTYEDIHLKYPLLFLTMRAPGHSELPTQILLNLAEANRRQLIDAGLREKNIAVLPHCTACDTKNFFSHRAEHGKTGRMMAVVGIKAIG
jgi:purine-nucleoside/S-methyl-5'-thioadenosine phosphorylase / adenosine deaminase